MSTLKQFLLFDKVQFLEAYEHIEYLEDGNIKYPPESGYHLYYSIISLIEDFGTTKVVEKNYITDLNEELDQEQNSSKDGINFCKNHNDKVFKVILGEYKSLFKEDSSYKNESAVTASQLINYEFIVAKFRDWYRRNEISLPDFDNVDEFLTIKKVGFSLMQMQNKIINRNLKGPVKKNNQPLKKDYEKDAKDFLKIVIKEKKAWPTLTTLKTETGLSISSWSRRLNDTVFLHILLKFIQKEKIKSDNFSDTEDKIILKAKENSKRKKTDVYSKRLTTPFIDSQRTEPPDDNLEFD